jgi:hypothetical protein
MPDLDGDGDGPRKQGLVGMEVREGSQEIGHEGVHFRRGDSLLPLGSPQGVGAFHRENIWGEELVPAADELTLIKGWSGRQGIRTLPRSARAQERSALDSNPNHLPTTEACRLNTCGPKRPDQQKQSLSRPGGSRTLFPLCKRGVVAAGPRDEEQLDVARVGVEPTGHEALSLAAQPVCLPYRYWMMPAVIAGMGVEPHLPSS